MRRTPEMQRAVDNMSLRMFGRSLSEAHAENICVACGQAVIDNSARRFNNKKSAKEYTISGLCQHCQDSTFKEGIND